MGVSGKYDCVKSVFGWMGESVARQSNFCFSLPLIDDKLSRTTAPIYVNILTFITLKMTRDNDLYFLENLSFLYAADIYFHLFGLSFFRYFETVNTS